MDSTQLIALAVAAAAVWIVVTKSKAGTTATTGKVTAADGKITSAPSRWDLITSNPAAYTSSVDEYGINGF